MKDMLAITHPAVLVRASWSKDWTVYVDEDRVLATRTGTMQIGQCWEELSPCPHATQGGRFLLRSLHVPGIAKDPRTELVIDRQWDVSGMPHLVALWRVVAFMLWSWRHFSQAGAKLSPSGLGRVRTPHNWQGCSACRDPAIRSRRHSSSSSFIALRNIAKRATPWTANLGTVARLVSISMTLLQVTIASSLATRDIAAHAPGWFYIGSVWVVGELKVLFPGVLASYDAQKVSNFIDSEQGDPRQKYLLNYGSYGSLPCLYARVPRWENQGRAVLPEPVP